MALRLHVEGERALFARPEFVRDLVTYDLMTPHAARGVLDAIYWRPGMRWVVDSIQILQPIRRERITRDGRQMLFLRDVGYVIEAHFDLSPGEPDSAAARHASMSKRAARSAHSAYLGRAEFAATVAVMGSAEPASGGGVPPGHVDHGWMLHGIDFETDRRPRYFRAEAVDGLVRIPDADDAMIFG